MVAFLAARIAGTCSDDKDIDLELHEFGYEAWATVFAFPPVKRYSIRIVFPLNVTQISQPALKSPYARTVGSGDKSYPRDLSSLLRFGGQAKRKEQSA